MNVGERVSIANSSRERGYRLVHIDDANLDETVGARVVEKSTHFGSRERHLLSDNLGC